MSNKRYASSDQEVNENGSEKNDFTFLIDQFGDIKIMRYQVPGFEDLSLNQKKLVYYLSQAARCGRDIIFDQNMKHNLDIRKSLDNIVETYQGDRQSDDFNSFLVYVKRFWFSNGFHHHYSSDKFFPEVSEEYFKELIKNSGKAGFPLSKDEDLDEFSNTLIKLIFDKDYYPKGTSQDSESDIVKASAVNFYENVTKEEVEQYNKSQQHGNDETPISHGLNSKLVKENGTLQEWVYKIDGLYGPAIKEIVKWLEKASGVAENQNQKNLIEKLIAFYKTGDLKTWDEYNILWVDDLQSHVDFINGFIETYSDPMGLKGTWESVVNFKNVEATKRTEIIAGNAQWFEDHSPVDQRFKKDKVTGVSAKVITVAQLGGDCYPSSPIGINLPNADWIRKEYGSKSVTMENITYSYDQVSKGNGMLEEFVYREEDRQLSRQYGAIAGNLHTDLHECLGHGSGQLLEGTSADALENYASPLEEARADLFALYYLMDNKMLELELMPSLDVAKAAYNSYIRNGLMTQLTRIEPGKNIEQAHMRNRQLIAKWAFEKGQKDNVIEKIVDKGKTYFVVNDHHKLRQIFGELLAEIQRIKSEGDYQAGKDLIEKYAVKVDPELHQEALERFKKLNIAPYGGFINPDFKVKEENGEIKGIEITYPSDYTQQMLHYGKEYSFL